MDRAVFVSLAMRKTKTMAAVVTIRKYSHQLALETIPLAILGPKGSNIAGLHISVFSVV